ncbi:MAG: ABC transporter ATP-binding protein [Candidatus Dormibacteria bacterium]
MGEAGGHAGPRMLSVTRLSKYYGRKVALDNLDMEVTGGEIVALLGPNGAGKTTTLSCLAGLLRPTFGDIKLDGETLGPNRGRQVALIPETPEVYDLLTAWEHMIFVARTCRFADAWETRASGLLDRLGLSCDRDTLGQSMSKGMKQKLLVAATVFAGTPVLLLDEPMIGLDPAGQRELRQILQELRGQGTAIIVSTHLLQNVESFCDRMVILKQGKVIARGTLAELLEASGGGSLEEAFLDLVG